MEDIQRYIDTWEWQPEVSPFSSIYAPATGVVVYLTTIGILYQFMKTRTSPLPGLRPFLTLHNAILCMFSFLSFTTVMYEVIVYQVRPRSV